MTLHEKTKQVAKYKWHNRSVCFFVFVFCFLQYAQCYMVSVLTTRAVLDERVYTCILLPILQILVCDFFRIYLLVSFNHKQLHFFSSSLNVSWNCRSIKKNIVQVTEFWKPTTFQWRKGHCIRFFLSWKENTHFIPLKRMFLSQKNDLTLSIEWKREKMRSNLWKWQNLEQIKAFLISRFIITFFVLNEKKTERKWSEWPSTTIRYGLVQCYILLNNRLFLWHEIPFSMTFS